MRGISTGGTDLIGLMIHKKRSILTLGQLLMMIDAVVIVFAVVVFQDVDVALYSVVTLFVAGKAIDVIQEGIDRAKVIYIVTENPDRIIDELVNRLGRGVTILDSVGAYSGRNKKMLMTVSRRSEISSTLAVIRNSDPDSFTILMDATEVHGKGFKEM